MLQFFQPICEHGAANLMRIAHKRHQIDAFAKKKRNKDALSDAPKLQQRKLNVEIRSTPAQIRTPRNTSPRKIVKRHQPPITNYLSLCKICQTDWTFVTSQRVRGSWLTIWWFSESFHGSNRSFTSLLSFYHHHHLALVVPFYIHVTGCCEFVGILAWL